MPFFDDAMVQAGGVKLLTDMVSAVMNNDQIEDDIKQGLKAEVGKNWSNLIDINQPEAPGKGPGFANHSPGNKLNGFGMDSNASGAITPASLPPGTI